MNYRHDGHTRTLTDDDLVAGNVLRTVSRVPDESGGHDVVSPFSDQVILGVYWTNDRGERAYNEFEQKKYQTKYKWVTLARPYLFASSVGTTAPSPLMGCEKYDVDAKRLIDGDSRYRVVLTSRGVPHTMTT